MKNKKFLISIVITALLLCSTIVVVASVLFKSSVKTQGDLTAKDVDKVVDINDTTKDNLVVDTSVEPLKFSKAGDSNSLTITVKNNTKAVIQYQYEFSFDSDTILKTESFSSAILVYFNSEFIDTLGNLCSNDENKVKSGYINFTGFVNAAQMSDSDTYTASSQTDELTFVLHSASDGSIFDDNTDLTFKLKTYAKTADYTNYLYVYNESDLIKAVDDINTGLLSENVTIVLFNDINITSANLTIYYPFELDLNGHYLNGTKKIYLHQSGNAVIKSLRKLTIESLDNIISSGFNIVLENQNGILEIKDLYNTKGTNLSSVYANYVTLAKYSSKLAKELISSYIKEKVRYGISVDDTINILNGLSFYTTEKNEIETSSNITFKSGNNTISIKDSVKDDFVTTSEEYITFNGEKVGVKVYGTDEDATLAALFSENGELYYLTKLAETDNVGNITTTNSADLFLPTTLKDKNITIEWKSNNSNYLSDTGIIQSDVNNGTKVSITGYFTINNKVLTKTITIKISNQNHDTIFQYFLAQLSPITIEHVYSSGRELYSYYYLPIVASSTSNKYHYTNAYNTPYNENSESTETGYSWLGFNDVAFESLTYTQIPAYNFISIDQNATDINHNNDKGVAIYLSSATFETYAQINLVAKFANDEEEYSGKVNIIINPGYDTSLNELVFEKTEQDLSRVDVLQNILDTRKENNMLNEKGDFILDGTYNSYLIQYVIPESSESAISEIIGYSGDNCTKEVARISGVYTYSESSSSSWRNMFTVSEMKQIVKYKVCLNPEGFLLNDSSFAVNVVLVMPTSDNALHTAARIQYFTCPGVIKCDSEGFANMSVFNSVKYQVWTELKKKTSESYNGDVIDDDYTSNNDESSFTISNGIVTNHTGAYILRHDAYFCNTIVLNLKETNTSSDNHEIYGLSKLISWATGDTTDTLKSHFTGKMKFDDDFLSTYGSYRSNGDSYLNTDEETVIKAYYKKYIKTSLTDDEWTTLINSVTTQEKDSSGNAKYYISKANAKTWVGYVQSYLAGSSFTYEGTTVTVGSNSNVSSYSKFLEVLQWAHNDKDFNPDGEAGTSPCLGVTGSADWSNIVDSDTSWTYSSTGGWGNSKYKKTDYAEDDTSYITKAEVEIVLAFLLNSKSSSNDAARETFVKEFRDHYFYIPKMLTEDGIATLISQAYSDLGKSLSYNVTTNERFKAEISTIKLCGLDFVVPTVTILDSSLNGLDYFPNITTFYVHGDYDNSLRAFNLDDTLTRLFNRITSNNPKLINLALEYCSDSNMSLSLENIYKLEKLKVISLQHNQAINNVGSLLKLDISSLSYVDIYDINVSNEYSKFVLEAINLKSGGDATCYWSTFDTSGNESRAQYLKKLDAAAEGLIYLEEFYSLLAENAQLTQNVIDENGNSISVQWSIEEGNGLTYVTSSNTSALDTMAYPYTNYFIVTEEFTYENVTFSKNSLIKIYSEDSGKSILLEIVKDPYGDNVTVEETPSSGIPESLSDDEVNQIIKDKNLTKEDIKQTGSEPTTPTSSTKYNGDTLDSTTNSTYTPSGDNVTTVKDNNGKSNKLYIYDKDGNEINGNAHYSSSYGFGYVDGKKTKTSTYLWYDLDIKNTIYYTTYKYYYSVDSNGVYTISQVSYDIAQFDSGTQTEHKKTVIDTQKTWYVNTGRSGRYSNYTYNFIDLLSVYEDAYYIYYGSSTPSKFPGAASSNVYCIYDSDYYSQSTTTADPVTTTIGASQSSDKVDEQAYYSAMASTKIAEATSYIGKTISITNGVTYYNESTQTNITSGIKTITLTESGFTYTSASSSTAVRNAKHMDDILSEANNHLNDAKFGLYYHKYYAYGEGTATYNGFTYTTNTIYQLELDSSTNKFKWVEVNTYEEITGSDSNVVSVFGSLTQDSVGKIYYYSGSKAEGFTLGTSIWFIVEFDESTGAYALKRFGTLNDMYLNCSSGTFSNKSNSLNYDGFKAICNIMEYMDDNYFNNGSTSTNYSYGVGGTRYATIKASITVNGEKYERLFLIEVVG